MKNRNEIRKNYYSLKRIISVVSQKGGVGKSTTSVNLAAYLSDYGYRTVLIDLDPQSNATRGLGFSEKDVSFSTYSLIMHGGRPGKAILSTFNKNLKLIPSTWQLEDAERELPNSGKKESRLKDGLNRMDYEYDFIIIDCSPFIGYLTFNALIASTEVLIPIQSEYYALEGYGRIFKAVEFCKRCFNSDLKILGILITMYSKTRLSRQSAQNIKNHFKDKVFKTIIPRNVRLGEAPSHGKSILEYDPNCKGAIAYKNLAREILAKNDVELNSSFSLIPRKIKSFWDTGKAPKHAKRK